jgi:predicted flap endonuclease-1-like 5' DNA nuclease
VNGLTFIALIALAVALAIVYRIGVLRGERGARRPAAWPVERVAAPAPRPAPDQGQEATAIANRPDPQPVVTTDPREAPSRAEGARSSQCAELAEDRHRLFARLADALAETARYRQIVVDIERNAPPPLLDAPGTPDDLKLIVGVGPALERMLYQLGITNYRQIARWSERDIDEIDAKLTEFPGRIRRDAWVTQARALHHSKYGERP